MKALVGTSGYNYPEWKGTFYPRELPHQKMLKYYSERLSTVEINATFYRMPNAKVLTGWAEATPDGFIFGLKAPRRITHEARLKGVEDPLRYFFETATALGPKLGPLLFQLPPYLRIDLERLEKALHLCPSGLRCAFEFRHDSWFTEELYGMLRKKNAALCIADSGKGTTPLVATADFGYFRLRDEGYSEEDLERWTQTVRSLGGEWREAFIYFKHEESGVGPLLAQKFAALMESPGRG